MRDYIHTADLAQAHQLAIESLEPGMGRAYNVGSGTGATVLEVLRACEEVGGPADPARGRRPTARRPGHAHRRPREDRSRAGMVAPVSRHPRRSSAPPGTGITATPGDTGPVRPVDRNRRRRSLLQRPRDAGRNPAHESRLDRHRSDRPAAPGLPERRCRGSPWPGSATCRAAWPNRPPSGTASPPGSPITGRCWRRSGRTSSTSRHRPPPTSAWRWTRWRRRPT